MQTLPLHNTALIHDEVLMEIIKVVEGDWPAGPAFVYALGSLVEAAVIHDRVFYDPMHQTQRNDPQPRRTIADVLNNSQLVQQLVSAKVLTLLPKREQLDSHLEASGSNYRSDSFLIDFYYGLESFSAETPEGAVNDFEVLTDLLARAPRILLTDTLIQDEAGDENGGFVSLTAEGLAAYALGFTREDMIRIESFMRRARGYLELTQSLEIDFYPVLSALPYQVGAIKCYQSKARQLYQSIVDRSTSLDEESRDEDNFSRVPIPPLAQIVIANAKDSISALVTELLALRERHRSFRDYLTAYERNWDSAVTRADRIKLRRDFDNAWSAFVAKLERPSTRIIYTVWDIFKNPANILSAFGDKLRTRGHELSVIGKVRGLHDFWKELVSSPIIERNAQLLKLFPRLAAEQDWRKSARLANQINTFLNESVTAQQRIIRSTDVDERR